MSPQKDIPGYEGLYQVDMYGNVHSLRNSRVLRPYSNGSGYQKVNLYGPGGCQRKYVHRLVAEAFLPNPGNLPVVNHKDADTTNNSVQNLEWCTQAENIQHCVRMGHHVSNLPDKNSQKIGVNQSGKDNENQ